MQPLFENMHRITRMLFGIVLLVLIGFVDFYTGRDLAFSIFYLIPIFLVVWYSGKWDGVLLAMLSSIVWLTVDIMGIKGHSLDAVTVWNALVRFGFFMVVVYLTSNLKRLHNELETKVIERTADLTAEIAERRRTEQALTNMTKKLSQLTKRIQVIREEENKVIAREIHDELGQALTAIKIDVAWLSRKYSNDKTIVESLFNVTSTVDDTIRTVRKISTRLRPRLLDELGLFPAIEWQAKDLQKRTGMECTLSLPEDKLNINSTVSSAIFRIFQEAVTNIARHSRATEVKIYVNIAGNQYLTMIIQDNGIGLPEGYLGKEHSLGILGMQERAHSIGGNVFLKSKNGEGTEVQLKVPLGKLKSEK